jgi:hypothetical protein
VLCGASGVARPGRPSISDDNASSNCSVSWMLVRLGGRRTHERAYLSESRLGRVFLSGRFPHHVTRPPFLLFLIQTSVCVGTSKSAFRLIFSGEMHARKDMPSGCDDAAQSLGAEFLLHALGEHVQGELEVVSVQSIETGVSLC